VSSMAESDTDFTNTGTFGIGAVGTLRIDGGTFFTNASGGTLSLVSGATIQVAGNVGDSTLTLNANQSFVAGASVTLGNSTFNYTGTLSGTGTVTNANIASVGVDCVATVTKGSPAAGD
ncbi:MAG: hypothetical protein ABL893_10815, partial [Hyphomicrobium sp.]